VVHGAESGQVHGSAYLVDLVEQKVFQTFKLDSEDIEWYGEEGGRGLRGIAIDGETIYLASSNRLLAFDRGFRQIGDWQNDYLTNCSGICIHERQLYLASAGNDCVLAFDLDEQVFHWAMQIQSEHFQFKAARFDPQGEDGPLFINKLHLKNIHCDEGGMRIAGLNTGGVLHFNGKSLHMSVELPGGAQDAQFFRNGVVFNDSLAGVVRYSGNESAKEDRAIPVPFFTPSDHAPNEPDESRVLKRGYARGLCILSAAVVAVGSTPAGVSLYDLRENNRLMTVNFNRNVLEAVNCIEMFPW